MGLYEIVHAEKLRLDEFISSLEKNIEEAVFYVEKPIVDLQREQWKNRQVDNEDVPITPKYVANSKKRKKYGLTSPNLYDTGETQKGLKLYLNFPTSYDMRSFTKAWPHVLDRYNKKKRLIGISPLNQPMAKKITTKSIGNLLKKKVFKPT